MGFELSPQITDERVKRCFEAIISSPHISASSAKITQVGESVQFDVLVKVRLVNKWRAQGQSPNGVRSLEPVRLTFNAKSTWAPPDISLRHDFSREVPHLQPWTTEDGCPVPCVYWGDFAEFYHQQGITGVITRIAQWLEDAADNTLIDLNQGWEATRRDRREDDVIVADSDWLRQLPRREAGFKFLKHNYVISRPDSGNSYSRVWLQKEVVDFSKFSELFAEFPYKRSPDLSIGHSVCVIVWPKNNVNSTKSICSVYTPESVEDIDGLKERAKRFHCLENLDTALRTLAIKAQGLVETKQIPLIVILCAIRPANLIGSASPIELCFYRIDFQGKVPFPEGGKTRVRLVDHRHAVTRLLLSNMSGNSDTAIGEPWTLIGAGSLGSKVAMHLARAGCGPSCVIDKSMMSPHNLARHALHLSCNDGVLFTKSKAECLVSALGGFDQNAHPLKCNVCDSLSTGVPKGAWTRKTLLTVNTTASLVVREALSAAPSGVLLGRVVEALLYSQGRLGVIATEGEQRNPSLMDMFAEFYAIGHRTPEIRDLLFVKDGEQLERRSIGEGCGSLTMPMSDGRLSIFAAATAEYLLQLHRTKKTPTKDGDVRIGMLDKDGLGMTWTRHLVPQLTVIKTEDKNKWQVRIHKNVIEKIEGDVAKWPGVETGGVILGRYSEQCKVFNVVDVFPAPTDCVRSSAEFILGRSGLKNALNRYAKESGGALYCIGTWHSHLFSTGPSQRDKRTAHILGNSRVEPMVMLIYTPGGFRAIVAE